MDIMEIMFEKKTITKGVRFKPTIVNFLKEMANQENLSESEMIEILVLKEYSTKNKMKGVCNEKF